MCPSETIESNENKNKKQIKPVRKTIQYQIKMSTNTSTNNTPSTQQQQQHDGKELYPCSKCNRMLGRHRFQKKIFRNYLATKDDNNSNNNLVCHQCIKEETAKRCKQVPPKVLRHDSSIAESGTKRKPNNFGYCDYVDKLLRMDCFASEIAPLRVFRSAKDISESMAALQAILLHGSVATNDNNTNNNNNNRVLCLCIGDGCTPQTAVLISFLTKKSESWDCVSIDPILEEEWTGAAPKGVKGLYGYRGKLDEFLKDPDRPCSPTTTTTTSSTTSSTTTPQSPVVFWRHLVLVCVHSHARFVEEASIERIRLLYSTTVTSSIAATTKVPALSSTNTRTARRRRIPPTTIVSLPCCPTFRHVRDIGRPPDVKYDDDCVFSACRSVEVWNFLEEEFQEQQEVGGDNDNNVNAHTMFAPPGTTMFGSYCSEIKPAS